LTTDTIKTKHLQTNTLAISDNITKIDEATGEEMNASTVGTVIVTDEMSSLASTQNNKVELNVKSTQITENSRIFLTVRDAPELVVAQVKDVVAGMFTIEFDYAFDETNWFIDWFVVGNE
jgi:hypothetical protein